MANNLSYKQYAILALVAILLIIGIGNYDVSESPSGYSTRYDVTVWTCTWDNGWHWIGQTHDYTWKLGSVLSQTEGYCNNGGRWTCKTAEGKDITDAADCDYDTEGSICTCVR